MNNTLISDALGCFRAAAIEGLQEALAETPDERLKDLVERRLLYAVPMLEEALSSRPVQGGDVLAWIHEDELPEGYTYEAMFPHSKVDGVRMFPVFGPSSAPARGQWQPIETAPKDGTSVILFGDARWPAGVCPAHQDVIGAVGEGYFSGGFWQFMGMIGEPTHWMPLPAAPGITKE